MAGSALATLNPQALKPWRCSGADAKAAAATLEFTIDRLAQLQGHVFGHFSSAGADGGFAMVKIGQQVGPELDLLHGSAGWMVAVLMVSHNQKVD